MNKMYAVNATEPQGGHVACHSLQMMPWRMKDKDKEPEGRSRAMGREGPETLPQSLGSSPNNAH